MPVSKAAEKKLRKDVKRTAVRKVIKQDLKKTLKTARTAPSAEAVREAYKRTDKAVKKHLLHKNKAARIKSALAKLIAAAMPAKGSAK